MKLKKQLSIAFIISIISLVAFSSLAFFVHRHDIIRFDSTVISYIQGLESPTLTPIMKILTFIGSTPMIIVLSIMVLFFLYRIVEHRAELILFVAIMIGAPMLNLILKEFFHRARPDLHRLIEITGYSFPSGHAMGAFAFFGVLTFLFWRHIQVLWGRTLLLILSGLMIVGIGISRIYLGVHYPTDIIGGYTASAFWLTFAIWSFQRYMDRRSVKQYRLGTE